MTEPAVPHVTTTLPPPSANGFALRSRRGRLRTRISDMHSALTAGALVMAAAVTARITQLRRTMRRSRRQPHAG
jgi:hypothetical protein